MNAPRRPTLTLAALVLATIALGPVSAQTTTASTTDTGQSQERPILLELFTSQGCHSCPPADDLLRELGKYKEIIPLSFHVDYWNHLGWQDPFSHKDWSQRQRRYATRLRSDTVYTPQLVIDGQVDEIGSDRMEVLAKISDRLELNQPADVIRAVQLDAQLGESTVVVTAAATPQLSKGTELLIALYERHLKTEIPNGENRNKVLSYDFVVRSLVSHHGTRGDREGTSATIALSPDWKREHLGLVAFVQDKRSGRILGIARLQEPLRPLR